MGADAIIADDALPAAVSSADATEITTTEIAPKMSTDSSGPVDANRAPKISVARPVDAPAATPR